MGVHPLKPVMQTFSISAYSLLTSRFYSPERLGGLGERGQLLQRDKELPTTSEHFTCKLLGTKSWSLF